MAHSTPRFSPERLHALQGILDLIRTRLPAGQDIIEASISKLSSEYYESIRGDRKWYEVALVEAQHVSARLVELNLLERVQTSPTGLWWVDTTHTTEEAHRQLEAFRGKAFWQLVDNGVVLPVDPEKDRLRVLLSQVSSRLDQLQQQPDGLRSDLSSAAEQIAES